LQRALRDIAGAPVTHFDRRQIGAISAAVTIQACRTWPRMPTAAVAGPLRATVIVSDAIGVLGVGCE